VSTRQPHVLTAVLGEVLLMLERPKRSETTAHQVQSPIGAYVVITIAAAPFFGSKGVRPSARKAAAAGWIVRDFRSSAPPARRDDRASERAAFSLAALRSLDDE